MLDYVSQLLSAINQYDPDDNQSVDHLRDVICWISSNEELKKDPVIAQLLYIASQKMRVFGYNMLNKFTDDPNNSISAIDDIGNRAIKRLYSSKVNSSNILDKSQMEVVEEFQSRNPRRLLVSAPTSYGKTFLMREIVFLNKERYNNILLVFPTVALLLENARMMSRFISENNLDYKIIKTVDSAIDDNSKNIFVLTPERALQLLSSYPQLNIDFFFFDEIYKIDEDYCNNEIDEKVDDSVEELEKNAKQCDFLNEDRGKTFRIVLYLLSKRVKEFYLAGPNLRKEQFGIGMKRYLQMNDIGVKEILFEPTLRITVDAYKGKITERLPTFLAESESKKLLPTNSKFSEQINEVVKYIEKQKYGKTLLYCTTPAKAIEYSSKLSEKFEGQCMYKQYPEDFQNFITHIMTEYDIDNSVNEWSLIKVLKNGFGMHHGKLPKYIQQEILEQFNAGTFNILFCTSTIVEGINTDAQNMIILNSSKGRQKLTPFDIKNIKGRAGRYYHCFIGRVFYMSKELLEIENSETLSLDFITYSDKKLGVIDLDNAEFEDLTSNNSELKKEREEKTKDFLLTNDVFNQNRTVSKENQEKLLQTLMKPDEYEKYQKLVTHIIDVESFLKYRYISKILETFCHANLMDKMTSGKFSAVANSYYEDGFKGILKFEINQYKKGNRKTIDSAYSAAFKSVKDIIEHKIPKILSLFESIIVFVGQAKGDSTEIFSLAGVRRYYETGVKSAIGEALVEYGFPTDAIRRLENQYSILIGMTVQDAKKHCRAKYREIVKLMDKYENQLFIKAMRTL